MEQVWDQAVPLSHSLGQPAPSPVCRVTQVFPSSGPDVIKPTFDLGETDEKKSQVSADSGVSLTSGSQVCDSLVQNREHSQFAISEYFFKTETKRQP